MIQLAGATSSNSTTVRKRHKLGRLLADSTSEAGGEGAVAVAVVDEAYAGKVTWEILMSKMRLTKVANKKYGT